ncbi:E3 ubiquitin-protein ligase CIP8-like [Panicum miliaceum]|uniref:E3 ubiquitin-protein ligase CIP8-like n=1 Tax=Panicum miliaceum TaxID=4540 RepID=A0A3L6QG85_PANMI|nr:E3 ubiquitin-protein ligase CIP8-like [Panicum miliaceum]
MAEFAGDDPFGNGFGFGFDFEDDGNYDPFDDYGGDGDECEGLIGGLVVDDGDGEEFCISGFAFRDGDAEGADVLMGEDHTSQLSDEDPILETLGRSFDSDGGFSQFIPHLVSALDASEEEDELIAGNYHGGGGLELEREAVIEEAADDDDDDGIGLMLSGFSLDPRPVVGGFQTLVDTDEAVTSDDGMGEGGGLGLGGFDLVAPRVVRPGWMVMGAADTDDADLNLLEMIAGHVGEAARRLRRPAQRWRAYRRLCSAKRRPARLCRVQGLHRGGAECPKAPLQALLPCRVHQAVARHQEHLPRVPV